MSVSNSDDDALRHEIKRVVVVVMGTYFRYLLLLLLLRGVLRFWMGGRWWCLELWRLSFVLVVLFFLESCGSSELTVVFGVGWLNGRVK